MLRDRREESVSARVFEVGCRTIPLLKLILRNSGDRERSDIQRSFAIVEDNRTCFKQ